MNDQLSEKEGREERERSFVQVLDPGNVSSINVLTFHQKVGNRDFPDIHPLPNDP